MNLSQGGVKNRQKSALQRLEKQLKLGIKPLKKEDFMSLNKNFPLSQSDINRINKEITTLKEKLKLV